MRSAIALGVALIAVTAFPACAQPDAAQVLKTIFPRQVEIDLALTGAPEHLRADATVYVFGPKGFELAREGNNGFTCLLNRDAFLYGSAVFKPTCWDAEGRDSYVPVMLRVGEMLASGQDAAAVKADIAAGFAQGRFHRPHRTGIAYMLAGDIKLDPQTGAIVEPAFPGHYMIYAPGVTNADVGFSGPAHKLDPSLPVIFAGGAGGSDLAYLITVPHHH